jgi:hypothetical protein
MPQFVEMFKCAGVDEWAQPEPGMVIPFGGSNVVALQTGSGRNKEWANLRVVSDHPGIDIEELDPGPLLLYRNAVSQEVAEHKDDPQYRAAMAPEVIGGNPRFFRIHGKKNVIDFPGALIKARSNRKVEASLRVVVVKSMSVKIAIRNLQVRDANGNIVFHSDKPCDPYLEMAIMDSIWIPQTNMMFDLVPSGPALIDTSDQNTKQAVAKGFGLRDPNNAVIAPRVEPGKIKDVFQKLRVDGTDITFFFVDQVLAGPTVPVAGLMLPEGLGFVSTGHARSTFAHEAGHFIGGHPEKSGWKQQHHTYDRDRSRDIVMLMRDGGGGFKIPFSLVKQFRSFSKNRKAKH